MSRGKFPLIILISSEHINAIVVWEVKHKVFLLIESPDESLLLHGLLLHHGDNFSVVKRIHVLVYPNDGLATFRVVIRHSREDGVLCININSTIWSSSSVLQHILHVLPLLLLKTKRS